MKTKTILISFITSSLTIALFVIFAHFVGARDTSSNEEVQIHQVTHKKNTVSGAPDFVQAANSSLNSVVHITTKSITSGGYIYNPLGDYFFGTPYQKRPDKTVSGSGSGVAISSDGYIATNFHVVKGADHIEVTLNDKRILEATLIGADPNTDLALLKVDADDLQAIAYGNSDELQIGEWVLAVGNPFNLTSTVTAGIVSAKGRNINLLKEQYAIESFIQTDAAVNPGNSGGALVDTEGLLMGINTAIASNTGSYTGYSFAIPVNVVKKVMNDLRKYGTVQRALLGIRIQEISEEIVQAKKLKSRNGVYITKVMKNSAAANAHLKAGDVITHIGNKKVNSPNELLEQMSQFGPGEKIALNFLRNGKTWNTNVQLGQITGQL